MFKITARSLSVEKNRSYMKAIRTLMGLRQYDVVRIFKDDRIIRESEISTLDGKIGNKYLWDVYGNYYEQLINESDLSESIKDVMRSLLDEWRRA